MDSIEAIATYERRIDNFDNLVGDDAATTSNQSATTSSGNANKSTEVDNKGGDPIEGKLKVRAKDVPKNKAMKKEPKKEDKGKKRKRKVYESDSDDDIEVVHVDQMECRALNQRITPKNFMNTVVKDFLKSHKAAIRKIGFGGFLDLDLDLHKSVFCSKLVSSFDCDRVSLVLERNQEIEITLVDIHLVYGLPMGGEIIKDPRQEKDEEWVEFIRRWRSCFGISGGSPSNSVIINRIEELKKEPVCDEFIWHFVVSVVNCCMKSTANPALNYKFLYSCMDIKKIECLDWCEYVYRSLKSSVIEWQGGSAYFAGPLPFLMILYFDRLERSKISNPRQFPLLSVWKKDLIKERMKLEMKRGFGKGHVLDTMEVDRFDNNVSQVAGDPELGGSDVSGSNEMLEFLQKFGTLAKKLAENLSVMHAMLNKVNEIFAKEEASYMNTFIQNIWNKYSMRKEEKQKDNPSILSQDKHLFDKPTFIKELDDVMKRSWEKFKGKKKTPFEMIPPSFDLFSHSQSPTPPPPPPSPPPQTHGPSPPLPPPPPQSQGPSPPLPPPQTQGPSPPFPPPPFPPPPPQTQGIPPPQTQGPSTSILVGACSGAKVQQYIHEEKNNIQANEEKNKNNDDREDGWVM